MKRTAPIILLLGLATATSCQHAEGPELEVEALTLRDALGLSPQHLEGLTTDERDGLKNRLLEAAPADHAALPWLDPDSPATPHPGAVPYDLMPTDPLNVMRRFDETRFQDGLDAWVFGVYLQGADGATTRGCGPLAEELEATDAGALPDGWEVAEDTEALPEAERALLVSLGAGLEGWRARCQEALGLPQAPGAVRVVRQTSAPFALAYWPQRNSLYVNPALWLLWGRAAASPAPVAYDGGELDALRTRSAALDTGQFRSFEECVEQTRAFCQQCDEQFAATNPSQCPTIYPNSPVHKDCEALQFDILDGFIRVCADAFLRDPEVAACFASNRDLCGAPAPGTEPTNAQGLATVYRGFSQESTRTLCREFMAQCASDSNDNPNNGGQVPGEVPIVEEPWEPTTLEGQCWSIMLNDTGCNDGMGALLFSELCYYDPKRPELRDSVCSEQQPTNCCGEQGEYPDPK